LEEARCELAAKRRELNKRLGLPATRDVYTISKLLRSLVSQTSSEHGGIPITEIQLSAPTLPGYTSSDLFDALEYANLSQKGTIGPFGEVSAAFATQGGLCRNYTQVWKCYSEEVDMPLQQVLMVGYTQRALTTALIPFRSAMQRQFEDDKVDWNLGAIDRAVLPRDAYWAAVKETIQRLPRESGWEVGLVVVTGDEGKDETFIKVLKESLEEIQGLRSFELLNDNPSSGKDDVDIDGGFDPLYLAAKGMALVAKRLQETQVWCEESPLCRKHRLPSTADGQDSISEL
jgi:hypothetical protein